MSATNSFDVYNLEENKAYHFRVTPRNRYGWGEGTETVKPLWTGRKMDVPWITQPMEPQINAKQGDTVVMKFQVI